MVVHDMGPFSIIFLNLIKLSKKCENIVNLMQF
jgi:hypothetical protein